jgi:hypothetical protein
VAHSDSSALDRSAAKAFREKKVYPPLQWRPLRVMNPWQKFAFLIAYPMAGRLLSWVLALALPHVAQSIVIEIIMDCALVAMARSFRGSGEPVEPPRAWWRLTARPLAGWWLGGMWILAAFSVFSPQSTELSIPAAIGSLILGVAFLNSSIRLTALRRRPQV